MRIFIIASLLVAFAGSSTDAQDVNFKPVADMTMLKVGGKTTRQEFLKMYPKAKEMESINAEFGVRVFRIVEADGSGRAEFEFLGDDLAAMNSIWTQKNTIRDKAWKPVFDKIIEKYGPPYEKRRDEGEYTWTQLKHELSTVVTDNSFGVYWTASDPQKKLSDLKAEKRANEKKQ